MGVCARRAPTRAGILRNWPLVRASVPAACSRHKVLTGMGASPKIFVASCISALLASCATYKPEPISPAANAAALESRSLDDPRLQQFVQLGLALNADPDPGPAWDLSKLTLAALYFHPDLDVARARLAAARASVITARQVPNPSLGLGFTYNTTVTTPSPWTIGAIISFILETSGRREFRTAQAEALAEAARDDLATASWQVRGRLRTAFLNLWVVEQRLGLLRQRLDLQNQLASLLERRFAVGEASALDVTRERINRNQINLAVHDAERQSAEARAQLAMAIGVPTRALDNAQFALDVFDKPVQLGSEGAPELRREALVNRTDVRGLLAEYEAAQSALQLEIASQYPNLTLGPGYTYDQGDNKYNLNLTADLPVFHQNQGSIARAQARRREVAARFDALQVQIIGAIDTATASYRSATQAVKTADALLDEAQARERQIDDSFRVGQTDRPTLVTAKLELAAIQLSRLDTLMQQRQALGALEDALQQPLFGSTRPPANLEQNPRLSRTEPHP